MALSGPKAAKPVVWFASGEGYNGRVGRSASGTQAMRDAAIKGVGVERYNVARCVKANMAGGRAAWSSPHPPAKTLVAGLHKHSAGLTVLLESEFSAAELQSIGAGYGRWQEFRRDGTRPGGPSLDVALVPLLRRQWGQLSEGRVFSATMTVKRDRLYLSTKNRSAATTLPPAVLDRYAAGPGSFGAPLRIPGVKTERTAKKRRKDEQKWARYGLRKRVRAAVLQVRGPYHTPQRHQAMAPSTNCVPQLPVSRRSARLTGATLRQAEASHRVSQDAIVVCCAKPGLVIQVGPSF